MEPLKPIDDIAGTVYKGTEEERLLEEYGFGMSQATQFPEGYYEVAPVRLSAVVKVLKEIESLKGRIEKLEGKRGG